MMYAIVTARVPVEVKEQGNSILKSIGSSPTQLINAAYDYLLAERKLPEPKADARVAKSIKRTLTPEQNERISSALSSMRLGPMEYEDFEAALNEARDERYAHIA